MTEVEPAAKSAFYPLSAYEPVKGPKVLIKIFKVLGYLLVGFKPQYFGGLFLPN